MARERWQPGDDFIALAGALVSLLWVQGGTLPPYNAPVVTRTLVLAMVLTVTSAVATPAIAVPDFATAKPIPGHPDFEITDNGNLVYQRDLIVARCGSTRDLEALPKPLNEQAASACEAAGYPSSLAKTGGLPVTLVPIALLIAGGELIRRVLAGCTHTSPPHSQATRPEYNRGGVGGSQTRALTTLVLVVLLAGCAAERGDGAVLDTTQEKTTADGTEETTVLNEETTVLAIQEPPDSTLSYNGREVKDTPGSFCWFSGTSGACGDATWPLIPGKQKTLIVPPGSEMVFRFGGQDPPKTVEASAYALNKLQRREATMRPDRTLKAKGSGVQRTIPAELPQGEYVLEVFVKVQQNDASYYFRILVE